MSTRADIMAFIGANARGFHDAMRRVRGDAKDTAQDTKREFANLSAGMDRSMNLLKTSLAGLGIGISLAGAQQVISDIASIDREARRAGISIKAFQEMKYVAEKNRIDVDAMIDGMKELSLRADEFAVTGKGSASEAFQRLGFDAKDVAERLKEPCELFAEIIKRVQHLNKAAQIRVMDELFGGSAGERFVELIAQGEAGIRHAINEAHDLGIVIEDELVAQAAELDAAFNTVVTTVGVNLKQAVVSVASEVRYVLDLFNDVDKRSVSTLEKQRGEKVRALQIKNSGDYRGALLPPKEQIESELAEIEKQIKEFQDRTKIRDKPDDSFTLPPVILDSGSNKGSRKAAISETERQKKAADELIQSLEHELSIIGLTDEQQKLSNELRKLGAGATQEQKDRITELITVIDAQKAAQERSNKAQQDFIDGLDQLGSDAVDALGNVIAGTEDAADAFKKLAIEIVKSALTGKGAYADFFNSLFGGGGGGGLGLGGMVAGLFGFGSQKSIAMNGGIGLYAKGGISDKPAVFGEAGPEAAVPLPDGRRIPVDLRLSQLPTVRDNSSSSSQSSGPVTIIVDVRGAKGNTEIHEMIASGVEEGLTQFDREILPLRFKQIAQDPYAVG
ncbi:tail tape measure protein [Ochrobactrum sp. Marseille-Q0166]|uniref:tail tape measure protein n=1 Tax=Ochrobactrum sp. Marseille-Q0166 TaxID=2761105 RepID=UPI0016563C08|nr:tail tape measure protein [Ochrobactrum sp. Marseille-Q0166]MBC8718184.1 tail tape measure protein [Ochrobactrum sp. Marseille-Q0166]